MKDTQALAFLLKAMPHPGRKFAHGDGRTAALARTLGISTALLSMWKIRGTIPLGQRPLVLSLLIEHGAKLPADWALPPWLKNRKGKTNGGASKRAKAPVKRSRKAGPQQRRGAARGGRPLVGKNRGGAGRRRAGSEAAQSP